MLLHSLSNGSIEKTGVFNTFFVGKLCVRYLTGLDVDINQIWFLLIF